MKFTRQIFNHLMGDAQAQDASDAAQAAFDKWLAEQEVVFKCTECAGEWVQDANTCGGDTHRARIVAIEEIKG